MNLNDFKREVYKELDELEKNTQSIRSDIAVRSSDTYTRVLNDEGQQANLNYISERKHVLKKMNAFTRKGIIKLHETYINDTYPTQRYNAADINDDLVKLLNSGLKYDTDMLDDLYSRYGNNYTSQRMIIDYAKDHKISFAKTRTDREEMKEQDISNFNAIMNTHSFMGAVGASEINIAGAKKMVDML